MGVLDPTGKEIFRHVIQGTSFDPYHGPDGTAVKLRESEKPYLAVMSHGSSGYARSVLLVFDPDGQLVWQEEVSKLDTLLAMPRSGGEGEALLVGGMNALPSTACRTGLLRPITRSIPTSTRATRVGRRPLPVSRII